MAPPSQIPAIPPTSWMAPEDQRALDQSEMEAAGEERGNPEGEAIGHERTDAGGEAHQPEARLARQNGEHLADRRRFGW